MVAGNITSPSYDITVLPDSSTTYRLVAVNNVCSTTAVSGSVTLIVVPALAALEYFFDTDPGIGAATQVAITNNRTDTDRTVTVLLSNLSPGVHTLMMRAKDGDGKWSSSTVRPFISFGPESSSSRAISAVEYYVDTDPGVGNATALAYNPVSGAALSLSVNTSGLLPGAHTLVVRAKDAANRWSINCVRSFLILMSNTGISRVEYFFDATNPALGSGKPVAFTPPNSTTVTAHGPVSVSGLSQGMHTINVRAQAGQD